MEITPAWKDRFKKFFLNNKFVLFLLVLLLIGLNILVLTKISYIFTPVIVLLKTIILPVILSGVLYYLLNPLVDVLERNKVKRVYSIVVLFLLIIGIIAIVITSVVPVIRDQIQGLIQNVPAYTEQVKQQFERLIGSNFVNQFQNTIQIDPSELASKASEKLSGFINNAWTGVGSFLGVITETVLAIATVPFILFYLLKDGHKLPQWILKMLPPMFRKETDRIMTEMNHQVSSYIRGQIIVSFCIGVLLYIGYLIIGLDYSLTLAVIASFTSVVPYLGPVIAITPALIVAIVTSPIMLLKMVIVWTVVQLIEGKFISPQIMGKSLRVHPITIIFVILTAGNLFGVVGIVLAVPGYAVLKVIVTHLFSFFQKRSHLYEADKVK
ncbi:MULTISPECIES: AI-2E family transporter [Paenibacillus]|uniref:Membrane protein n=1 Tax=Paenibacillus polymyxa (strain SC2) TaxID=886882 RepID=E3E795_PAEPS|nr:MULTISPECIES: AI-2E family transporter [Paenibacillus]MCV9949912.1 AI-2E family transporter [Paenibacillus sp. BT-177]ADO58950.1 membrane protein [Paenibacillus polymyxa SC2]KAF6567563.1 AI-2E family transporter [Paenibacillus sp. EKM202P]KAF6573323.1 AI-2E family transporter [Paenibacillus sp. EKM207P]TKH33243.1 AI-2E family transporter [Paenibacillus polymyxa]